MGSLCGIYPPAKWRIIKIGIDGCTAFTKKTNILIVEDNFL